MGFGFMVRNAGGKETLGTRPNLLYVLNAHFGKRKSRVETLPGAIAILRCLAHCFVQHRWETGSCLEIIWVSTIHHHRPMNLLSPSLFVFHRAMWPVLEGPLLLLLQLLLLQPLCLMTITTTIVATRTILGWVLDASKMAHGSSVSSHFSCALLPTWRLFSSGLRAFHFRPILPAIVVLA